jgi:WhiB family transcriptional regulator, redox-sensing transcriptional regulator
MSRQTLYGPTSPIREAADTRARSSSSLRIDPVGRHSPANLPCQIHDAALWFAEIPTDLERAKALCADCPARLACLGGAIQRREPAGVWGGQIFDHGQIVTHKRPRGRPRKNGAVPHRYPALPETGLPLTSQVHVVVGSE